MGSPSTAHANATALSHHSTNKPCLHRLLMLIGFVAPLLDYSALHHPRAVQLLIIFAQYGPSLGLHRPSIFAFWARNLVMCAACRHVADGQTRSITHRTAWDGWTGKTLTLDSPCAAVVQASRYNTCCYSTSVDEADAAEVYCISPPPSPNFSPSPSPSPSQNYFIPHVLSVYWSVQYPHNTSNLVPLSVSPSPVDCPSQLAVPHQAG